MGSRLQPLMGPVHLPRGYRAPGFPLCPGLRGDDSRELGRGAGGVGVAPGAARG